MKWKTLAVLALALLAGCGGGDDDDDGGSADNGGAADTGAADTSAAAPAPEPVKGKVTEAKLIAAANLKKQGDGYVWKDGCKVKAVAVGKDEVKKLQKAAANPRAVVPNKSETAAIEIVDVTYPCAVHATLVLRGIP